MGRKKTTEAILVNDPEPTEDQFIARVINARGQNLYEVMDATETQLLVELPPKFRSLVWVKRGSFVIVDSSGISDRSNKIQGAIVHVLLPVHIKYLRKQNKWPKEFDSSDTQAEKNTQDESEELEQEEYTYDNLIANPNHQDRYISSEEE